MKHLRAMVAVLLAVATVVMMTQPAIAATKKEYVSEVVACPASSFSEAKDKLTKAGYNTLDNSNLNVTLDTGVYVGYKTTTNPDEALTDIAAMNMNGGYSASKYEDILKDNRDLIDSHIEELYYSISGFQENYKNKKKSAIYAEKALNRYTTAYDDNKGTRLGDYFLAFDYSDSARSELVDVIMKGNAQIIKDIETMLVSAAETGDDTFIERLSAVDYDTLEEQYVLEYGDPSAATDAMSAELGEIAISIYNNWNSFADYLENIGENYVIKNADGTYSFNEAYFEYETSPTDGPEELTTEEAASVKELQDNLELVSKSSGSADFALYCALALTEYGDGTMLDYFTQRVEDMDIQDMYPVAWAMNDAQRNQIDIVGVRNCIVSSFSDIQNRDYDGNEIMDKSTDADDDELLSVYTGVDLSIFEDGVAMTTQAEKHEILSGDNWLASIVNDDATMAEYEIGIAVSTGIAVVAFSVGMLFYCQQREQIRVAESIMDLHYSFYEHASFEYRLFYNDVNKFTRPIVHEKYEEVCACYDQYLDACDAYRASGKTAIILKRVSFAIMLIALAVDAYLIWKLISTETKDLKEIPHHMVTAENDKDMETFVYYSAVKNLNGSAADINNGEADKSKGWLVLYTTSDKRAGDPIEANGLRTSVGAVSFGKDDAGVHMFGETSAANLVSKNYTGYADVINGLYLVFSRDHNAYTASAFSSGVLAASAAGGVAAGALITALAGLVFKKRKSTKEAQITDAEEE